MRIAQFLAALIAVLTLAATLSPLPARGLSPPTGPSLPQGPSSFDAYHDKAAERSHQPPESPNSPFIIRETETWPQSTDKGANSVDIKGNSFKMEDRIQNLVSTTRNNINKNDLVDENIKEKHVKKNPSIEKEEKGKMASPSLPSITREKRSKNSNIVMESSHLVDSKSSLTSRNLLSIDPIVDEGDTEGSSFIFSAFREGAPRRYLEELERSLEEDDGAPVISRGARSIGENLIHNAHDTIHPVDKRINYREVQSQLRRAGSMDCCPSMEEIVEPQNGIDRDGLEVLLFKEPGNVQRFFDHSCLPDVVDRPCAFIDRKFYNQSRCVQKYSYSYAIVRDRHHHHAPERDRTREKKLHHDESARERERGKGYYHFKDFPGTGSGSGNSPWRLDYIKIRSGCGCEVAPKPKRKRAPQHKMKKTKSKKNTEEDSDGF